MKNLPKYLLIAYLAVAFGVMMYDYLRRTGWAGLLPLGNERAEDRNPVEAYKALWWPVRLFR